MSHKYIDLSILYDTSQKMTRSIVLADFDKYRIHNIMCENEEDSFSKADYLEYRGYLADALYMDYMKRGVNYHAYIEEGMNARFMMELRKSALLRLDDNLSHYYADYADCETVEDIKRLRIECLKKWCSDYEEFDWQIYMVVRWCWGNKSPDILIDYECCFDDGDYHKMGNPEIYRQQFLEQHIPKELILRRDWTGVVQEPIDWEKYYEGIEPM